MTYFLSEQSIIQEANVVKENAKKAIFWMAIQDADNKNQNKRIYPYDVLNKAINNCMDMVNNRCFYGEYDHPVPQGNSSFDEVRQTTVLLEKTSHIITDFQWKDKVLFGKFETLSTKFGKELLGLLKDQTRIGTSMRGLAELERKDDASIVQDPLILITYDIVSRPSHLTATVDEKQVNFENVLQDDSRKELLFEHNLKEKNNQILCDKDGTCYLADYIDKLIEQKTVEFVKENWG